VVEALDEAAGVTVPKVAAKTLVIDPTATELAHFVFVVSTTYEEIIGVRIPEVEKGVEIEVETL
jgi:hypothetical protein